MKPETSKDHYLRHHGPRGCGDDGKRACSRYVYCKIGGSFLRMPKHLSGGEREIYLMYVYMHICIYTSPLVGGISQLATMVGCSSMRSPLLAPPPGTGMELFFAWGMRAGTAHAGTLAPSRILEILLGYRVGYMSWCKVSFLPYTLNPPQPS